MQRHSFHKTFFYEKADLLKLSLVQNSKNTKVEMHLLTPTVNTHDLPHTLSVLQELLPSVLYTKCFNEKNLSFIEEVTQTEIGHLFEHILLENLCLLRIRNGRDAIYNGVTHWNWFKYPKGTFHITLDSSLRDQDIFPQAMTQSLELLEHILQPTDQSPLQLPVSPLRVN